MVAAEEKMSIRAAFSPSVLSGERPLQNCVLMQEATTSTAADSHVVPGEATLLIAVAAAIVPRWITTFTE